MAAGKGILAADESTGTMVKRFEPIGVEQTPDNDQRYRNLLFTAPDIEKYLSGVILHDETIRQASSDGTPFAELLARRGILPGIKVDLGLLPLAECPNEEVSKGLEDLGDRLDEYAALGAHFTKWRSVIHIGDGLPTDRAIHANAEVLAEYAARVQEHHMVPMVEPEVLFDGTHTLARSGEVLRATLHNLFETLAVHQVLLQGLVLKTSMALPGKDSGTPLDANAIAAETVAALRDSVPAEVAGIVFLSGGQTPEQATENLNAIAQLGEQPWPITFSYSRAIEEPVLAAWAGKDENIAEAQRVLVEVLERNVAAREGRYTQAQRSNV